MQETKPQEQGLLVSEGQMQVRWATELKKEEEAKDQGYKHDD